MRIAIVDDLAAERTLLKGRLEWQLQRRKNTGGYSGIRKRRDISGSGKESAPLLPHFWIFIWMA